MRCFFKKTLLTTAVFCVLTASAFNPPTDEQTGVRLSIDGVPDAVFTAKPLNFDITLKNESTLCVSGMVSVWMNEDWDLRAEKIPALTLAPGQTWRHSFTATARPRVLEALYPIHARFTTETDTRLLDLHPIAVFKTTLPHSEAPAAPASATALTPGPTPLTQLTPHVRAWARNGETRILPYRFNGTDTESGATLSHDEIERAGVRRRSISIHPPWKGGHGSLWSDYRVRLPFETPILFKFNTAIRDVRPDEPSSDGVEFKVFILTSDPTKKEVFTRHTTSTVWQSAEIDLSAYASQTITLRLWNGPGPKNDTTCDNGFWGDPVLQTGPVKAPISETLWATRTEAALRLAREALSRKAGAATVFRLESDKVTYGAAVVTGDEGLTDGVIAFSDGTRDVAFRGFTVETDGQTLGGSSGGNPVQRVAVSYQQDVWTITHHTGNLPGSEPMAIRATLRSDHGVLRIAWDIQNKRRDDRGEPRFTRLAIGPATRKAFRIYLGFGAVFEEPGSFLLPYNGVQLSTRHIGADYENGLSLVQATDLLPDRLVCAPSKNLFALETPHDACFLFAPSARGAYAAARAYRKVCGFKPSPGVDNLLGRVCLDQWGGDTRVAAKDLALAAKYGLNHCVFVKHDWQRWGYDYRLPEIYPPAGGLEPFREMRTAAKEAGMLFAPHDNYIDFYPDAEGFSYNRVAFHADGTPHKAWFHPGRHAQSYRWRPDAFTPWLSDNMRRMQEGFAPDALFIDVFTSIAPFDYYDRDGVFHTRAETVKSWRSAFDTSRKLLGHKAAMLSESGHDALIGSIDGVQADHWRPECWLSTFTDADRTPWHDMVTHGNMVLFAGGLGNRYDPDPKHGYGSDDYLSNTVLGGRGPMCDGPFSRRAVLTYWLLHDVCAALARVEMKEHAFGSTLRQQHTTFDKESHVWVNRGTNLWTVANGRRLPEYGFYVQTRHSIAGVLLINGHRAGFAKSEDTFFADARPRPDPEPDCSVETRAVSAERLGPRSFRVTFEWRVLAPLEPGFVPFVHIGRVSSDKDERIEAQAGMVFDLGRLTKAGTFTSFADISLPKEFEAGDYLVHYGLYHAKRGDRVPLRGDEEQRRRIRGGTLRITSTDDEYLTKGITPNDPDVNRTGAMLDFGPVVTDGAFRLTHDDRKAWQVVPLPASRPFHAEIRLDALDKSISKVASVERVDPRHACAKEPEWRQEGDTLYFSCDALSFGYRIVFK